LTKGLDCSCSGKLRQFRYGFNHTVRFLIIVRIEQFPFEEPPEADPFARVRPAASAAFDWLTVEAIWRGYQRYGRRAAIGIGVGLVFLWYLLLAIPVAIVIGILSAVGAAGGMTISNTAVPVSFLLAVGVTLYGGYRTYNLLQDRRAVNGYAQSLDLDAAASSFDHLDSRDDTVRRRSAQVVATGMENEPNQLIDAIGGDEDEVAYTLAELLHDDDEDVRVGAANALVYFSQVAPNHVAQYRDDVYAAMKYPNAPTQVNSALTTLNMAEAEPGLSDEALRHVQPLCEHGDPDVREAAAMALGAIRNNRATELLRALMEDSNPAVRQRASEVHRQTR